MKKKFTRRSLIMLTVHLLLVVVVVMLLMGARGYKRNGTTTKGVQYLTQLEASVGGGEFTSVTLPHTFRGLAPRSPVVLKATICPQIDDGVFIETRYAPARVYLDGKLVFQFGKQRNYPLFMKDPAIEVHIVETHGNGTPMELQVEYMSPKASSTLRVNPFMVGSSKEEILERSENYGTPWIFSILQSIVGGALILISVCILLIDRNGELFLWLGLFNTACGLWVFGANNFSITVFLSSTSLYLLSAIGLFTMGIPLLHFARKMMDFHQEKVLWYLELLGAVSSITALLLQLLGVVPCYRIVPLFHTILPLVFVILTGITALESFYYKSSRARWFLPPMIVLTFSACLDLFGYQNPLSRFFNPSFQLGSLVFLLIMGVEAGILVKDSVNLRARQKDLEFQNDLMEIRLQDQQSRSLLLAEHEQKLRQQRHDLRHQLVAIQELAAEDPEKLQGYLQAMLDNIPKASHVYCENTAVNAVVAHFATICQQHGIELSIHLEVPSDAHHVSDGSLCAVFGNLMENAMEACGRMSQGRKFIKLNSRMQYNMLTITMDNSFSGQLRQENGCFYSSKRDAWGIGLTSIRSIAEKSGGSAHFQADGYVFMSSVLINL